MKVKKLESQYIRKNGPLKLKIWGYNPKTHPSHMFYYHFSQKNPKKGPKSQFPSRIYAQARQATGPL